MRGARREVRISDERQLIIGVCFLLHCIACGFCDGPYRIRRNGEEGNESINE